MSMLLTLGVAGALSGPPPMPCPQEPALRRDPAAVRQAVRAAVTRNRRERNLPAIMVAAAVDGEVFLAHAEGTVGRQRQADATTLFPMGGLSRVLANLTFARLQAAGALDLDRSVNRTLQPFVLRDLAGEVRDVKVGDLLRGRWRFPHYENDFPVAEASRWSLERVVAEHARGVPPRASGGVDRPYTDSLVLPYALVQRVAEVTTGKSWHALVLQNVAGPLRLRDLVPDGRAGLPATAAGSYRVGMFGLRVPEKNVLADVPAARGAWIHAQDLGRLLVALVAAAPGADDLPAMRELVRTKVAFANFRVIDGDHPHLWLRVGGPGRRAGLALYPQFRRGWAVFTNLRTDNHVGMPALVRSALEKQLLPPPPERDTQWNTSVGLGGGVGGMFQKGFDASLQGEWRAAVRWRGRVHPFHMWIDARQVRRTRFGEAPARPVRSTRLREITVQGTDLIPVRAGVHTRGEMVLQILGEPADRQLAGWLEVRDTYCRMTFPVVFAKVKDD